MRLRNSLLLLALLISACSKEVELPPAAPLEADASQVAAISGIQHGPYEIVARRGLELPDEGERRPLAFNLWYPSSGESHPLLLFSHGNWSTNNAYDKLVEHWVSHGYVVLAPEHLDCCSMANGIMNSLRYGQLGLIEARTEDLVRVLDKLDAVEALAQLPAGRMDRSRIAATGHSFGAWSAQQLGGAEVFDPDSEQFLARQDERIRAVVAVSPPGPMFDTIVSGSWDAMNTPTLVTTGTWDIQPQFWPDWRMHLMSHERAQAGEQYALVVEGADHYFGSLICRTEREAEPQWDALRMVQATSTSFLNAQLKEDKVARELLTSDSLTEITGGFATLQLR